MPESVISLRAFRLLYGSTEAVGSLDLAVHQGEVVGLIGPDGAGKTSTLRTIAGLQRASSGHVNVLGGDAWATRRTLHTRLGYLAQRFALYGDLSVDENVRFFALLLGVRRWQARRDMLLERVGLAAFRDRAADRLSGGMKQKLALACSLMHSPEILLLDEPTTGVDPVTRREFWRLLSDLVAEGLTLVVATPYLDEAERCSRVVLMHHGRVLADAPPAELVTRMPGAMLEVRATPRGAVVAALAKAPGVLEVTPFAAVHHVHVGEAVGAVARIGAALAAAGLHVEAIREVPIGLEDTFLYLTRQGASREEAA